MKTSKIVLISVGTTILTNIVLNTWLLALVILGVPIFLWIWAAIKGRRMLENAGRGYLNEPIDFIMGPGTLFFACGDTGSSFWKTIFPFLNKIKFQSPIQFEKNSEEIGK